MMLSTGSVSHFLLDLHTQATDKHIVRNFYIPNTDGRFGNKFRELCIQVTTLHSKPLKFSIINGAVDANYLNLSVVHDKPRNGKAYAYLSVYLIDRIEMLRSR